MPWRLLRWNEEARYGYTEGEAPGRGYLCSGKVMRSKVWEDVVWYLAHDWQEHGDFPIHWLQQATLLTQLRNQIKENPEMRPGWVHVDSDLSYGFIIRTW